MAYRKISKKQLNKQLSEREKEVQNLLGERTKLTVKLAGCVDKYNSLCSNVTDADEWVYSLPINSIKELGSKRKRTKLGDLKIRSNLKKQASKLQEEIQSIDNKIKIAQISLTQEKINFLLQISK